PTYEYHCPNGHEFEVFQRMSDDPLSECPECGAKAQRQISGGAGFLFKGDGFYITDNRSEDYKKKASADSSPTSSSKDSSSGDSSGSSSKDSS
ncbi:MAG TPA: FmdB family transcriptional regulator, partial [Gemmatimonadetes bacterium]|nr:FmdB family transcriptional regulator [Gemmatimonadota bacterium]